MTHEEKQVADFFGKKGLQAEEFTKQEKSQPKTPDFRVFRGNKLAFFCEVKTISRDEWLDNQLKAAPPGKIVGGFRKDPVFNRLSNKIHEAVKQFDVVNPNLEYPNVLVFVNHDDEDMCGFPELVNVITGDELTEDGARDGGVFGNFSEGRIKEEKLRVHLFIWIDGDEFEVKHYYFNPIDEQHFHNLCSYFDQVPEKIL